MRPVSMPRQLFRYTHTYTFSLYFLVTFLAVDQTCLALSRLSKEKWDAACEHAKTAVQVYTHTYFLSILVVTFFLGLFCR